MSNVKHNLIIRQANKTDMDAVWRITYDAYLEQGYCNPRPDGRLIHYAHLDGIPETTVLIAEEDGIIIGTNSLTVDGPAGLHVDDDFKTECDLIRAEGRNLASSWRIVTKSSCRNTLSVIKGLICETFKLFHTLNLETIVFTFNPRHERIYKRMLNARTIARHDGSIHSLNNAPAVFMRTDIETCPNLWPKNG